MPCKLHLNNIYFEFLEIDTDQCDNVCFETSRGRKQLSLLLPLRTARWSGLNNDRVSGWNETTVEERRHVVSFKPYNQVFIFLKITCNANEAEHERHD